MLKKVGIFLVLALCLFFLKTADAKINVGIDLGYQTLGMADVNSELDFFAVMAGTDAPTATVTKITTANLPAMGIKGTYELNENVSLGLKIATLSAKGKVEMAGFEFVSNTLSLMPISIGGGYKLKSMDKISVYGELYLGMATSELKFRMMAGPPGTPVSETTASGSGTSIDIGAAGEYKIAENISLGLSLGYKMCTIAQFTLKSDIDMDDDGTADFTEGEVLPKMQPLMESGTREDLTADFSGINLVASINYKF
jgi:hypothetical protein